ncbi:peptidoglycan-binding domain-containing protein [Paracoccus sp. (in: a-proteobacteria)]|uniref:peptidoglycan-binding domain-containing protein n=1 Tax=Paracoccus sp. TaxID=267 RepID=UPI0032207A70
MRFAFIIGAALPLFAAAPALAEDVVIRIEARRSAEAAQTAADAWGASFPDVVTFPLAEGWFAIALGPMPREAADARLAALKTEGKVPGDSFLSPAANRVLTPLAGAAPAAPARAPQPATAPGSTFRPGEMSQPTPEGAEAALDDLAGEDGAEVASAPEPAPEAVPAPEPAPLPAAPQFFMRIESSSDRLKAEEMLTKWRRTLPEAGLWALPNGHHAVGFGPMDETTGKAWLRAFRAAGVVPEDAFLAPGAEMGELEIIGARPDLAPPPDPDAAPVAMPDLAEVQRALRWAGHYDGAIDGKDGPMTREAIAAEIVRLRASPEPGAAMAELLRRREAWRQEIGLTTLSDSHTGLSLPAPMDRLQFDRAERALSIYGPRNGSGAALILFSQPGGQQEMLDLAGLVTALGWVPAPERRVERGSILLDGRNQTHIGHAEGTVVDGRVQGFVLIWPLSDPEGQRRLAAEISDRLARFAPGAGEVGTAIPAAD